MIFILQSSSKHLSDAVGRCFFSFIRLIDTMQACCVVAWFTSTPYFLNRIFLFIFNCRCGVQWQVDYWSQNPFCWQFCWHHRCGKCRDMPRLFLCVNKWMNLTQINLLVLFFCSTTIILKEHASVQSWMWVVKTDKEKFWWSLSMDDRL